VEGETIGDLQWETDRGRFLGRGRTVRAPRAQTDRGDLSRIVGSVLNPIVSLRRRVRLLPGYTHAAVWTAIAFAPLGDGDKAAELIAMLNPITHAATPYGVQQYRVEPYVVVGDIYSEAPHVGQGGWTWYTGSAGWLYRAGIEWLLGVRVQGTRLVVDPCIPSGWPVFTLALRHRSARYDITVENPGGVCRGVAVLEVDGVALDDLTGIPLTDDQRSHRVRAVLGGVDPSRRSANLAPGRTTRPEL
jgi:cellobiose phosphorylase